MTKILLTLLTEKHKKTNYLPSPDLVANFWNKNQWDLNVCQFGCCLHTATLGEQNDILMNIEVILKDI